MQIPVRKLFWFLISLVALLLVLNFFPEEWSYTIADRFNLDREANIPTWYSTVLLFSISIVAFSIATLGRKTSPPQLFWLMFGAAYSFLSLDEGARLHEIIDHATSLKWVLFYAPVAAPFIIVCAYYLTKSGNKILRNWICGGLVVSGVGAFGAELVSHFYHLSPTSQQIEFAFEEGMELIGTIIVLRGCLEELNRVLARTVAIQARTDSVGNA